MTVRIVKTQPTKIVGSNQYMSFTGFDTLRQGAVPNRNGELYKKIFDAYEHSVEVNCTNWKLTDLQPIEEWCKTMFGPLDEWNPESRWNLSLRSHWRPPLSDTLIFHFHSREDAAAFRLRWS